MCCEILANLAAATPWPMYVVEGGMSFMRSTTVEFVRKNETSEGAGGKRNEGSSTKK